MRAISVGIALNSRREMPRRRDMYISVHESANVKAAVSLGKALQSSKLLVLGSRNGINPDAGSTNGRVRTGNICARPRANITATTTARMPWTRITRLHVWFGVRLNHTYQ